MIISFSLSLDEHGVRCNCVDMYRLVLPLSLNYVCEVCIYIYIHTCIGVGVYKETVGVGVSVGVGAR